MRLAKCPHCGSYARVYTSRAITPRVAEQYVNCTNIEGCDHKFVIRCEIAYTIRPSLNPDPKVVLPMSPRASPPATPPMPANDEGEPAVAEG